MPFVLTGVEDRTRDLHEDVSLTNAQRLNQTFPSTLSGAEIASLPTGPHDDSSGAGHDDVYRVNEFRLTPHVKLLFKANWQVWNFSLDNELNFLNMAFIPFGFFEQLVGDSSFSNAPVNYMHDEAFAGNRTGPNRLNLFRMSLVDQGQTLFNPNFRLALYLTYVKIDEYRNLISNGSIHENSYKYLSRANPATRVVMSQVIVPTPTSSLDTRAGKAARFRLVNLMFNTMNQQAEGANGETPGSGGPEGLVFINGFVGVTVPAGGCSLSNAELNEMVKRSKTIFSPPPRKHPSCFWECLAKAQESRERKRKRASSSFLSKACELRYQAGFTEHHPVNLSDLDRIADVFDIVITAINLQREELHHTADLSPIQRTVQTDNHYIFVLQDSHWMYPKSITGCVFNTVQCDQCKMMFENEQQLQAHRKDNCLKCFACGRLFSSSILRRQHKSQCTKAKEREIYMEAPERKCYQDEDTERYYVDFESLAIEGRQEVYAGGIVKSNEEVPVIWYGRHVFQDFFNHLCLLYSNRAVQVQQKMETYFEEMVASMIEEGGHKLKNLKNMLIKRIKGNLKVCPECSNQVSRLKWHAEIDPNFPTQSCLFKFWKRENFQSEMDYNFLGLNPPISVFAHNGGGYDWKLFFSWLMRNGYNDMAVPLMRGGKILELKFKRCICLKDSIRMGLMGSLEKLAKSFKSPILKGEFPYTFLDSWSKIEGVYTPEQVDRYHFTKTDKEGNMEYKRAFTEEEHAYYFQERYNVFDVREQTITYLTSDILALRNVCETYWQGWLDMTPCITQHPANHITSSQLSFGYYQDRFMPSNLARLQTCETNAIRAGTQGGRVESLRRYVERSWVPPTFDQWMACPYKEKILDILFDCNCIKIVYDAPSFPGWDEDYGPWLDNLFPTGIEAVGRRAEYLSCESDIDRYHCVIANWPLIRYYDVNSEYPFIMENFDMPVGLPSWYVEQNEPLFSQLLNEDKVSEVGRTLIACTFEGLMDRIQNDFIGFACVDIVCNQGLHLPVLPERRKMGQAMKTMFTLWNKNHHVYYSQELKLAVSKGYRITRVYWICEFEGGKPFGNFINTMKEIKYRSDGKDMNGNTIPGLEKNPALRAASKLAMNSTFGKCLQKADGEDFYVSTSQDLSRLLELSSEDAEIFVEPVYCDQEGNDVVKVKVKYANAPPPSCANVALGNAILSLARCWLYEIMDECLQDNSEESLCYCDTDSLIYYGRLPRANRLHETNLGQLAGEFRDDSLVKRFVTLSAKVYAFDEEVELNSERVIPFIKAKGVNSSHNFAAAQELVDFVPRYINMSKEPEDDASQSSQPAEETSKGLNFDILYDIVKNGSVTTTMNPQMLSDPTKQLTMLTVPRVFKDNYDKRKKVPGNKFLTTPWSNLDIQINF